jgi:hypothetical protein
MSVITMTSLEDVSAIARAQKDSPASLEDILDNPELTRTFEDFLDAELAVETIYFLRDEKQWRDSYYNISKSARLARAKIISKAFIASTGNFSLNISFETVTEVVGKLEEAEEEVPYNVFAHAVREVSQLLRIGPMPRFLRSEQFEKTVTENKGTSPTSPVVGGDTSLKRITSYTKGRLSNLATALRIKTGIRSINHSSGVFSEVSVSSEKDKDSE